MTPNAVLAELLILADPRGEPMGGWAAEPVPGAAGRWSRLTVLRAREWRPVVRAGRELEAARAVAALDFGLAPFPGRAAPAAAAGLRALVAGGALDGADPATAAMLEAFGVGEPAAVRFSPPDAAGSFATSFPWCSWL